MAEEKTCLGVDHLDEKQPLAFDKHGFIYVCMYIFVSSYNSSNKRRLIMNENIVKLNYFTLLRVNNNFMFI